MNFAKPVSKLMAEDMSRGFKISSENSSATALTTVIKVKLSFTHFSRGGHPADHFYHDPASEQYKKQIKHGLGIDKNNATDMVIKIIRRKLSIIWMMIWQTWL